MKILRIETENFRNLAVGGIDASEDINVIYGDNAQGKTNLLEALWMFSGAKSFRGAKDADMISRGAEFAKAGIRFFSEEREQTAEMRICGGRQAVLNGINLRSPTELSGKIRAVVFSPAHLSLIKDGPIERRRFLDTAIAQLWPKYIQLSLAYSRAVTQRNTVLKDARFHAQLYDMLEIYEDEIAEKGALIAAYRQRYVDLLNSYAPDIYDGISHGRERLGLKYITSAADRQSLSDALARARNDDISSGATSVGPHRDDLNVTINDMPARQFGSQGQQRSAVLAMKLSEAAVQKKLCDEQPIALLDDVMSELDIFRQDYILNHIRGWQVFITCCDKNSVGMLKNGRVFHMQDGVITAE